MRTGLLILAISTVLVAPIAAQVASPPPEATRTAPQAAQPGLTPPPDVRGLLSQLEQASVTANGDVAGLRIDKWKADRPSKRDAESMAQSIQRNLTVALPGMIAAVRNAPDNLAVTFTLYRNLDTLYDVFSTLANMTGALGPKQEYDDLARDVASLEQVRRGLADQIQQLAAYKDSEVSRLVVQLRNAQAAVAAAPPTKILVDDNEPDKKPVRKKKAPAKPPAKPDQTAPPKQ